MVRYLFLILLLISTGNASDVKKSPNQDDRDKKLPLLRDGFVLNGVDGKITARGEKWYFEIEEDVSDKKVVLPKGTRLQMLKSSGLEKMINHIVANPDTSFRLFNAMITTYEKKNFIFCDYFVPISMAKDKNEDKEELRGAEEKTEIRINEPNDTVIIPQEIIDRLSTRRIVQPQQIKKGVELKQDSILSGRTGFVKKIDGKWFFMFDSLGRNRAKASLELLPCQSLERAQRKQAQEPVKIRYKVSGIVTKYKGRYYLVLQRVTPAYNYGNFGS